MTAWTASPRAISVTGTNGAELIACAPLGMAGTKEWAERAALMAAAPALAEALRGMLQQFTKTPSTLADSEARGKAHAVLVIAGLKP